MLQKIKCFIDWLNSDDGQYSVSESVPSSHKLAPQGYSMPHLKEEVERDEIIQDKLRVLSRSGLALPHEVWQEFVVDTVVNYALWCQDLPASESYHHVGKRGLLLHSLDVAIYAMRLRRNYILPPNTPPEDVIHREIVWVYGVFLCALLHDSGKIHDVEVELHQGNREPVIWNPVMGPIDQPYRCRYHKQRQYATHQFAGHGLLNQIVSVNPMTAITHDKVLFHTMLEYLSGNAAQENVIAQIIKQADAASVAQDLGADKAGIDLAAEKARQSPTSLAGQLRLTLVHLLESEQIPLNKKGAEGFVDGESLFLVSKPIADRLRSALIERGITSVPTDNSRLFNELQQHHLIRPNTDEMAIWKCDVALGELDWCQTFTCVCVHWPSLLPEGKLESVNGTITPVTDPSDKAVNEETGRPEAALNCANLSHGTHQNAPEKTEQVEAILPESKPVSESSMSLPTGEQVSEDLMQFLQGATAQSDELPVPEVADTAPSESTHIPHVSSIETNTDETEMDKIRSMDTPSSDDETSILLRKVDLRETKGTALGECFIQWVDAVLRGGVHPVNRQGALFHRLEQGMFVVSPGAFRTFVSERCHYGQANSYSEVQLGVQALSTHLKTEQGRNVHKALIKDSSKTLNGFLFPVEEIWAQRYAINPHVYIEEGA
ncbi:MobH family relaxase [Vibrio mediterranei]|uniref:MobH family relaxase n=1 Tax=Vibrio mediterranei TaxID=689 RepID=UPI0038CF1676